MTTNSWNNQITSADVIFNGGTVSIGADAASNAINIGTGAAARTTTIGNTTGASAIAINVGTGNYTLASATGNLMVASDDGTISQPLQPSFECSVSALNVTGDGTYYQFAGVTSILDANGDLNATTGIFTAPIDGLYMFQTANYMYALSSHEILRTGVVATSTTSSIKIPNNNLSDSNLNACLITELDAGDTAYARVYASGGSKIVDVQGRFSGSLIN